MLWKIWETRWEMPWMEDSEKERRGSAKLLLFLLIRKIVHSVLTFLINKIEKVPSGDFFRFMLD